MLKLVQLRRSRRFVRRFKKYYTRYNAHKKTRLKKKQFSMLSGVKYTNLFYQPFFYYLINLTKKYVRGIRYLTNPQVAQTNKPVSLVRYQFINAFIYTEYCIHENLYKKLHYFCVEYNLVCKKALISKQGYNFFYNKHFFKESFTAQLLEAQTSAPRRDLYRVSTKIINRLEHKTTSKVGLSTQFMLYKFLKRHFRKFSRIFFINGYINGIEYTKKKKI
jgi:hypothetical protein